MKMPQNRLWETFISNGQVSIAGQITSNANVDIEKITREKLKEVGYDNEETSMDYRTCKINVNIVKQSNDIAIGVDEGGAGDQGIMFGYAHHGGGAFSGKDGTKVDRSASYMLRHIAKCVVANGLARKCEIQISYGIGMKNPISFYIDCFGTNRIPEIDIINIIKDTFDLTPEGIIEYLKLKEPIYSKTTNYGHFGRDGFTWEELKQI